MKLSNNVVECWEEKTKEGLNFSKTLLKASINYLAGK